MTRLPGHLKDYDWDTFPDYVKTRYKLTDEALLMELVEKLDGITVLGIFEPNADRASLITQRKAMHGAAKAIVGEAAKLRTTLAALRESMAAFEIAAGTRGWSAAMLDEVFDIPPIALSSVEPPEGLDTLRLAMADPEWTVLDRKLEALMRVPVRARLRKNSIANQALLQGLQACRMFWQGDLKRSWARTGLRIPEIHVTDKIEADEIETDKFETEKFDMLVTECEFFVVDMLTAANIPFTLKALNGAWAMLDKKMRIESNPYIESA